MKILVTNDDGIYSTGIAALADALKEIAEVTVVAPSEEQSAVGHGITMKYPLRVNKYYKNGTFFGYAVEGTPADCVKMGIRNIMGESPDLVISGINHGSNTAINIIYSGTVSAAKTWFAEGQQHDEEHLQHWQGFIEPCCIQCYSE